MAKLGKIRRIKLKPTTDIRRVLADLQMGHRCGLNNNSAVEKYLKQLTEIPKNKGLYESITEYVNLMNTCEDLYLDITYELGKERRRQILGEIEEDKLIGEQPGDWE
jgi:hypothetical protein